MTLETMILSALRRESYIAYDAIMAIIYRSPPPAWSRQAELGHVASAILCDAERATLMTPRWPRLLLSLP